MNFWLNFWIVLIFNNNQDELLKVELLDASQYYNSNNYNISFFNILYVVLFTYSFYLYLIPINNMICLKAGNIGRSTNLGNHCGSPR